MICLLVDMPYIQNVSYLLFVNVARVGFGQVPADFDFSRCPERRGRVLAVLGAGHLVGVQKWLAAGGVSESRIQEIASSTKHNSTWPGRGILQIVNSSPTVSTTTTTTDGASRAGRNSSSVSFSNEKSERH
jgi:hypothetical protein